MLRYFLGALLLFNTISAKELVRKETIAEAILEVVQAAEEYTYTDITLNQLQHALECAKLAVDQNADEVVILASLLHIIGDVCAENRSHDGKHTFEYLGASLLIESGVDETIAQLVASYPTTLRYLIFKDPSYREKLHFSSLNTLNAKGGPMNEEEAAEFESDPLFDLKIQARLINDEAYNVDMNVYPLEYYLDMLARHIGG